MTGPDTGGPPSGPKLARLAILSSFESLIIGGLILIPLFAAIAWVRGQS
jgi:hypothetical protein